MHLIQIIRSYLGATQKELAQLAGISQPDLCEMETKKPYGWIDKYQKLSDYLEIPVHALVTNDCTLVPLSFFARHPGASYMECSAGGNAGLGRRGEDAAFVHEVKKLEGVNPALAKLVLPHYKLRNRPGYDILSFDEQGNSICIEVKTTADDNPEFHLTKQEYQRAKKAMEAEETYLIYRFFNFGKKDQKLKVYDFRELHDEFEFAPATFALNRKKEPTITGIQHCREMRNMSKGELADNLGIKTPDLWRYENGKRRCPVGVYQRMASILNVTIDELLMEYAR